MPERICWRLVRFPRLGTPVVSGVAGRLPARLGVAEGVAAAAGVAAAEAAERAWDELEPDVAPLERLRELPRMALLQIAHTIKCNSSNIFKFKTNYFSDGTSKEDSPDIPPTFPKSCINCC